jgi:hypothetical protein
MRRPSPTDAIFSDSFGAWSRALVWTILMACSGLQKLENGRLQLYEVVMIELAIFRSLDVLASESFHGICRLPERQHHEVCDVGFNSMQDERTPISGGSTVIIQRDASHKVLIRIGFGERNGPMPDSGNHSVAQRSRNHIRTPQPPKSSEAMPRGMRTIVVRDCERSSTSPSLMMAVFPINIIFARLSGQ